MRAVIILCSLTFPVLAQEQQPQEPKPAEAGASDRVMLGEGQHVYQWVRGWGRAAGGKADAKDLGNTHGCLVVDKDGNILANTDTENAVVVFSPAGEILRTWGKDFHGGLHGMCLRVEDGKEVLYLAHTRRHEVVKTAIDGTVVWTIGWPQASGIYEKEDQFKPTAVAVAPDGRIFVADGYGRCWVHLFDQERKYVKSFGGTGQEPGKMQTPHGLWMDTRGKEPLLLVCDRENHRLQWFSMDGEFVRLMDQDLRRPCNVAPLLDGGLAVADLAGRVTLLGKDDKLVVHLGDNPDPKLRAQNGVPRDKWQDGVFLSPHGICVDKQGSIYVMDWNSLGRVSKLAKTQPAKQGG